MLSTHLMIGEVLRPQGIRGAVGIFLPVLVFLQHF